MQKLLLLFISSSYDVEVLIPISYTFSKCRSCFSCSFYLPLMQKFLFFFLFYLLLILVDFTFLQHRSSYSCWFHGPPVQKVLFLFIHVTPMQRFLFSFSSRSSHVVFLVHSPYLQCGRCYFPSFHFSSMEKLLFLLISPSSNA